MGRTMQGAGSDSELRRSRRWRVLLGRSDPWQRAGEERRDDRWWHIGGVRRGWHMAEWHRRPGAALFALSVAAIVLNANTTWGRRVAPKPVAPLVYDGVRYEAPHFNNPCQQNGGCIVAFDNATGAQLWYARVYCTVYEPNLESDVQDVFITSMAADAGQLEITNEKGLRVVVDLGTRQVMGGAPGCRGDGGGCSHSPMSPRGPNASMGGALFGLLILARRWRGKGKGRH